MSTSLLLAVAAAFVGGVAIGIQNPLAAVMGERLGPLQSAFIVHVGGALAGGLVLLAFGGGRLAAWRDVPPHALGAGLLGLMLVSSVAFAVPRIGLTATVALVITGQLLLSAWLDHHGLLGVVVRPVDATRAAGILLLLGGAWLVVR